MSELKEQEVKQSIPEQKAVRLFNPTDEPFGKLSNNAYHLMKIENEMCQR